VSSIDTAEVKGSTTEQQVSMEIAERGGPEVFTEVTHPVPVPGAAQILIRTHAAGMNPVDWKVRAGVYSAAENFPFPITVGRDFSGTVLAVGAEAAGGWQVGDEVVGTCMFDPPMGAYSTHLVVTDAAMVRRPETVSPHDAAALPIGAMTAWQALHEVAEVKPGQRVLVHAGAGGVGHFVVQLAKAAGCEVVATCSPVNDDFLRGLGADQTVDYNAAPFEEQVTGFDVVIDGVGGDVLERSYGVLKPGGIAVTMAFRPDPAAAEALGVRTALVFHRQDPALLESLLDMVARGDLSVHIDASYPLAEAAAAQTVLEGGHVRGKLVLSTR
jgi:NADPH:quinone reductase-like Zn-dependent oxidoreductase